MTRRGFLAALGIGAVGAAVAKVLPKEHVSIEKRTGKEKPYAVNWGHRRIPTEPTEPTEPTKALTPVREFNFAVTGCYDGVDVGLPEFVILVWCCFVNDPDGPREKRHFINEYYITKTELRDAVDLAGYIEQCVAHQYESLKHGAVYQCSTNLDFAPVAAELKAAMRREFVIALTPIALELRKSAVSA